MAVVFGGVLLCAFSLQILLSPAGDLVLNAMDGRRVTITGAIGPSPSGPGKLALRDGLSVYVLTDIEEAKTYYGHEVRVTGIFYDSTGVLRIQKVELTDLATSRK